ncbi:uncharacterized protein LOC114414410 isoform X2 [Glycine soja]|uniref:uncharacterized protein LOC114414410 isoform X2 n=1 Tax=Glycine soja TaxID=3848 RepID=UPI0007191432|nr:uncharacterized protein LOC114414410 isoform X2 [Glycine soja]|eukprot:XP_014632658.1 uncharacterized protein LOC100803333 isoform X2 [Glycine max]
MEEGKEWSVKEKNETTTRPSLKSDVPFNKYELWKHKLRDNCYKRVREDRTRLLWKFRYNQQEEEDIVKCAFQDIVSDELNKIKRTDELLWEYEGPHQGECQDILLEMQRIFYQDLNSQSTIQDLECDIETWEDEVDEYLARAVFEHMQLNEDELTLDFLRDRLAEAHTEHLDKGCRLKPKFCMRTKFNLTALYISCEGCDTFEVVI